jgi:hypothetical protein
MIFYLAYCSNLLTIFFFLENKQLLISFELICYILVAVQMNISTSTQAALEQKLDAHAIWKNCRILKVFLILEKNRYDDNDDERLEAQIKKSNRTTVRHYEEDITATLLPFQKFKFSVDGENEAKEGINCDIQWVKVDKTHSAPNNLTELLSSAAP